MYSPTLKGGTVPKIDLFIRYQLCLSDSLQAAPMNSMKRQNGRILKEEHPRSVGAQYATGDQWRNNSRINEETEPKEKLHPVVDVTSDGSKV